MTDTSNVIVGKPKVGGAVWVAPVGTSLPTDATSVINTAFKSLGYISEDGVTNAPSMSSETKKAWGGDVVATIDNGTENKYKMKFIETLNAEVQKLVYGDSNVTDGDGSMSVANKGINTTPHAFVIDMVMANNLIHRMVIPSASITEIGEIKYVDSDVAGYEVTLTAKADTDGATAHDYYQKAGK